MIKLQLNGGLHYILIPSDKVQVHEINGKWYVDKSDVQEYTARCYEKNKKIEFLSICKVTTGQ